MRVSGFSTLLILVLALPATAETLNVPKDYATIQEAVDAAVSGDTIKVKKGVYPEGVVITKIADLTLKGSGKPVIDGEGARIPIAVSSTVRVTISGFTLVNSPDDGVNGRDNEDLRISKVTITDCAGSGVYLEDGLRDRIEKCTIENTRFGGVELVRVNSPTLPTDGIVEKCKLRDIDGQGVEVEGSGHRVSKNRIERTEEEGILIRADDGTVEKNRITDAGGDGISVDGSDSRVEKNRITTTADRGIRIDGEGNLVLKNNLKFPGKGGIDVSGTGNVIEKNSVKDCEAEGYRLRTGGNRIIRNKAKNCATDVADDFPADNFYDRNTFEPPT
jgi:nitrous oxidase accessory protein NosD